MISVQFHSASQRFRAINTVSGPFCLHQLANWCQINVQLECRITDSSRLQRLTTFVSERRLQLQWQASADNNHTKEKYIFPCALFCLYTIDRAKQFIMRRYFFPRRCAKTILTNCFCLTIVDRINGYLRMSTPIPVEQYTVEQRLHAKLNKASAARRLLLSSSGIDSTNVPLECRLGSLKDEKPAFGRAHE